MSEERIERDGLGEVRVPAQAYYGAQTQRAVENFRVSGQPMPAEFVHALGRVKEAAARTNRALGLLDETRAGLIERAAREVADGALDAHFPVDVFQTGSATSSNMNANEVIARRARELGGAGAPAIHPNDHVNLGQSSNDIAPTAFHVAAVLAIERELLPALRALQRALAAKAERFDGIVKSGRTHLMDATPIRLGQEFSGWAAQVEHAALRVEAVLPDLRELAAGGTAVGTGLNAHREFGRRIAAELARATGSSFVEARNHFEAQGARDAAVWASGALNALAASLRKIASDVRLLASGPHCGLAELRLPAVQPGSSIMPGKVNPVICESVIQVAAQVAGNHVAITLGAYEGQLELNTALPLLVRNLLESVRLLARVARIFAEKAIDGIEADAARCADYVERSPSLATALNPLVGYDRAASVARRAAEERRPVREVARELLELDPAAIERALDPRRQTEPGL